MQNYKYQAFISYSHENERAAARLQKALEAFAVPKHLKQKFPNGHYTQAVRGGADAVAKLDDAYRLGGSA